MFHIMRDIISVVFFQNVLVCFFFLICIQVLVNLMLKYQKLIILETTKMIYFKLILLLIEQPAHVDRD